ncbi:MAG: tRNA guanosine(34) transglycosylase Tgt [Candidatus Limnocylindria bacterium]
MTEALRTRRGTLAVPTFLPDATRAGVRGISADDLRAIGVEGVVVNAFHLLRRPGARVLQAAGGVHRFMGWEGPVVSDSGGFQVWSLIRQDPARGVIRDNEVIFREPATGQKWNLTPERVIGLQLQMGSDVVICLDDCTDADAPEPEQERSVERTVRWARRSREAFDRLVGGAGGPDRPLLFAVVQGGGVEHWRRQCAAALAEIGFDGYGFGGWPLAGDGSLLSDPLRWVVDALPADAPKHGLGIGRPDHLVAAAALGYSVFDCALPTRDARHGRLYAFRPGYPERGVSAGSAFYRSVHIHDARYRVDHGPIEDGCDCPACLRHSRAYLHHLFKVADASAERLATLHNLRFYVRLVESLRAQ